MTVNTYQRKEHWTPTPRPQWVQTLNEQGAKLDMASVVPLDSESLIAQAVKNTGLGDFGDDAGAEHFRVLARSIEEEANLHFAGRILTRSEFVRYLEIRFGLVDWLKRAPEILDEKIDQPIFITGYGRSGTTILYEVLSLDPRFRVPLKWESLFPFPPPESSTYDHDPRIARADKVNEFNENMIPELSAMHKSAGSLPVESLELNYFTFLSEVYPIAFQVPTYDRYLEARSMDYSFEWQKKFLKLLQWRCKGDRWLLKGPSHLPYLRELLGVYPDARIIFTHRDPVVCADSGLSLQASLYWWRTDEPWGDGTMKNWLIDSPQSRAQPWDDIIDMIEDGTLKADHVCNSQYDDFMTDPMAAVRKIYTQLGLDLTADVEQRMRQFLAEKPQGQYGRHEYEHPPREVIEYEREVYKKYQDYFSVPNEL